MDTEAEPKATDSLSAARAKAAQTGVKVEVEGETTESSITYAMPDGTVQVEAAAGPVRVLQDGAWVDVDTTLRLTPEGVEPVAVPGDTVFSAGGNDDLASLGDGDGTSISMSWEQNLPVPVLDGDTATYRNVFPGVDLTLTATRLGFSQLLVVNQPPSAATQAALASIDLPIVTTGADVSEGDGGQLQVADDASGEVLGTAAAPTMWDARTDPHTDEPVAVQDVGLEVTDTAGRGSAGGTTLTLSPDTTVFTDPATVYPVTIDPTAALGALGDTFVQSSIANTPQGGSTELRTGTYDGGATAARSLLRFDMSAIKNRPVSGATLGLFEFHSWSCSPTWVDVHEAGDFDPNTVTWGSQPGIGPLAGNAYVAFGYSSACPANWVDFNLTGLAQSYSTGKGTVMPLAVTASQENDNYGWKKFNSGNAGGNVPVLNVTWDDNCTFYGGYKVCGLIRDAYVAKGGPNSFLGLPLNDETPTPNGQGAYNHFQGGSIYWSGPTGAHSIQGAIRDKWASLGWESSFLGFPTTDETAVAGGFFNHFAGEHGSIYFSGPTGAHTIQGSIKDLWGGLGYETSFLGFPSSDEYTVASGRRHDFTGGQITWDAATNVTNWTAGPSAFAGRPGWATDLTYQLSDLVSASVNVATGNLNLAVSGLTVPGIGGDRGIGVVYNSMQTATGSVDPTGVLGAGFRLSESPDVRLIAYGDGSVRYVDASGRAAVYERNGTTFASPVGDGGTQLTLDAANNWVLTTLASQRKQVFRASDGLMISDTDRNGVAYTFGYNSSGKPTTITGTRGGAAISYTFGGTGVPAGYLGKLAQTVDGTTRTVVFGYNSSNRLTSITHPDGTTTTLGWTGTDITTVTPPAGKSTSFSYDTGHRVSQIVRDPSSGGFNATTKLAWGNDRIGVYPSLKVTATDPNGKATTYISDAFGKVTKTTDPLGHSAATTYSPNNDVLSAADAMPTANLTNYTYNGADGGFTPTGATAPTGASATATYPTSGTGPSRYLPGSTKDTQGNVTTNTYDAAGNPTQQVQGGVTTSTSYNPPAGQATTCVGGGKPGQACTETDGKSQVTTYTYDGAGNLLKVTPPAGVVKPTSYTYDGAGRKKTVTDGKGQVTTYVYDGADRVTQIRYGNASNCGTGANCEVYSYDGNGNLKTRVDGAGTTSYSYDALNRLTTTTTAAGSGGGAQGSTLTYDLGGNTLTFTDSLGTTRYGYDAGNNLTSLAEPGGSCTGTAAKCTTYAYNANDVRTQITYPGGTTVQMLNIDASSRPLQYKAVNSASAVLMDFTYSYTRAGADTGMVQTRSDATVAGTAVQTYSYDGLNRLTRALEKVGTTATASWTYCYDANGNRTFDSTSAAATVLCPGQSGGPAATYAYDATDALTSRAGAAFSYDANGAELTGTGTAARTGGTWNTRGQLASLTSAGTTTAFTYAGESQKERLTAGASGYQNTALGVTTQTGTGAASVIREPNGTPVALRIGTAGYYFIADQQGSTIGVVDASGAKKNSYSYDPYGASRTKTETVINPWQYTGGQLDGTGLYHLQARYFDSGIGRFTQADPSGQEANSYLYAGANPVNYADPTGQFLGFHFSWNKGVTFDCGVAYVGQVLATGGLLAATFGSGGALAFASAGYIVSSVSTLRTCR